MRKIKILFFAADPFSVPPEKHPRLLIDKELREIRRVLRAAKYRDDVALEPCLASQTDDLLQALNEVQPDIVHFSGHGTRGGLVLHGADERPHFVSIDGLVELFRAFAGPIRAVVFNACFSSDLAAAVANVVGCAIGTTDRITDPAAIKFSSSFYRAVAFGCSVQAAFDQGRAALAMDHPVEKDCPKILPDPKIDRTQVVLIEPDTPTETGAEAGVGEAETDLRPPPSRGPLAALLLSVPLIGAAIIAATNRDPGGSQICGIPVASSPGSVTDGGALPVQQSVGGVASDLLRAKGLYRTGRYAEAIALFRRAAAHGNAEATAYLGILYLREGANKAQSDSAIEWLRRAAGKGEPRAMTALAAAYQSGQGVGRSLHWAEYWYSKAANKKAWPEAMWGLGRLYQEQENYRSALLWFRSAVGAGWVEARVEAGLMYENSFGVSRDVDEALCLYRSAADAGSPRAMAELARVYRDGIGVQPDTAEAGRWSRKAGAAASHTSGS